MPNDALLNAISKYTNNKEDISFETNIVRILIHIYNEVDFLKPFLLHDYNLIDSNLLKYGLPKEELSKFKEKFNEYMLNHNSDAFLTIYKIIMDMIFYKYKNKFITDDEVKEYEKIFFQGRSVETLNKYWDQTLYKINNKLSFTKPSDKAFNPYGYYLQGKNMHDIKEMPDKKLYYLNRRKVRDYNANIANANLFKKFNKVIHKEMLPKNLSSGNGFVDILMILSFIATEVMVGAIIAVQMIVR